MATAAQSIQKPIRPLTTYHLFFQLEREYLIQSITSSSPEEDVSEHEDVRPLGIELDKQMPLRYQNIRLSPSWYVSASGKRLRTKESDQKRKHRKSHGKIGFQDLSRQVASRWRILEDIDNETKIYCANIAKRELCSYKEEIKQYKTSVAAAEQRAIVSESSAELSPMASPHNIGSKTASSIVTKTPDLIAAGPSHSASFDISQEFHPTWMKDTKLSVTESEVDVGRFKRFLSTMPPPVNDNNKSEFSFFPLPPFLQEPEDSFLESCKKRRRFSSDVGDSTPSHTFNDDRNDDVIFDSTMRDLSPPYASDKESKRIDILQRERINMLSKQSTPDISSGNITPLHWKTQADYYKFTKQDAAMLLKALFD